MSVYRQLPLQFKLRENCSFESYISGENAMASAVLQQAALGCGELQVYLWGGRALGKSHVLQAACNLAVAQRQAAVCYLPVAQIMQQPLDLFDGLEQLDLVCLDDIQHLAGNSAWEEALFDLINRMRAASKPLLMSAHALPEHMRIVLPDLRSRLLWGPVFQLLELQDADKRRALQYRARQRGLEMPDNVVDYLMRHYPRDLFTLFERLETLDTAAMAMQRKLTIPFIKAVFANLD